MRRAVFYPALLYPLIPRLFAMLSFYVALTYGVFWFLLIGITASTFYVIAKPHDGGFDDKKESSEERMQELISKVFEKDNEEA